MFCTPSPSFAHENSLKFLVFCLNIQILGLSRFFLQPYCWEDFRKTCYKRFSSKDKCKDKGVLSGCIANVFVYQTRVLLKYVKIVYLFL